MADGWDYTLDWNRAGKEINSTQWNQGLENNDTVVLDCRNSYETDVGIFDKAIPLNTTFFRESWDALDEILNGMPKDKPILTYCTGGIRCVKINAYLEQKLGFTNVSRLAGGIISYVKEMQKNNKEITTVDAIESQVHLDRHVEASKFKGMNYVFDERMGSRVTKDILSTCETCGERFDVFTNCANTGCHIRFIQCKQCSDKYDGCCSRSCQKSLQQVERDSSNKAMLSRTKTSSIIQLPPECEEAVPGVSNALKNGADGHFSPRIDTFLDAINLYCERRSSLAPDFLHDLKHETEALYPPTASRMLCGHLQGRLIVTLCSMMRAKSVLELGTFTGRISRMNAELTLC